MYHFQVTSLPLIPGHFKRIKSALVGAWHFATWSLMKASLGEWEWTSESGCWEVWTGCPLVFWLWVLSSFFTSIWRYFLKYFWFSTFGWTMRTWKTLSKSKVGMPSLLQILGKCPISSSKLPPHSTYYSTFLVKHRDFNFQSFKWSSYNHQNTGLSKPFRIPNGCLARSLA